MQALLIRHGETPGNAERRYIGRTDEPLSEKGLSDAKRAAKDPELRRVFVSPYIRARETASILFPNAEQIVLPGLRETDFGIFEGKTADEMAEDPDYRAWVDSWCEGPIPGGESRADVAERAAEAFSETVSDAIRNAASGPLVFVTHGGVIMALLSALAVPKKDYYDYSVRNLSGWSLDCREENGKIILENPERFTA